MDAPNSEVVPSVPNPTDNMVVMYLLCPRFIPAQNLRKRLEAQKIIRFDPANTPDLVFEAATKTGGIILYHIAAQDGLPGFIKFLNSINPDLASGKISLIVITKILLLQLRNLFSRYPATTAFPTTVPISDVEEKIMEVVRRNSRATGGKDLNLDSPDQKARANSGMASAANDVYVVKGQAQKTQTVITDRLRGQQLKEVEEAAAELLQRSALNDTDEDDENVSTVRTPKKRFNLVESELQRKLLIRDCVESRAPVVIVNPKQPERMNATFYEVLEGEGQVRCKVNDHEQVTDTFRKLSLNAPRLNFSAGLRQSQMFLTTSKFQWVDTSVIELVVPKEIYVVQRRTELRLVFFPDSTNLAYANSEGYNAENFCFSIYDISPNGISLIGSDKITLEILSSKRLRGLKFQIEDLKIQVDEMKLRHATGFRSANESLFHRLGFQFKSIDRGQKDQLEAYINRYSEPYINKFIKGT